MLTSSYELYRYANILSPSIMKKLLIKSRISARMVAIGGKSESKLEMPNRILRLIYDFWFCKVLS